MFGKVERPLPIAYLSGTHFGARYRQLVKPSKTPQKLTFFQLFFSSFHNHKNPLTRNVDIRSNTCLRRHPTEDQPNQTNIQGSQLSKPHQRGKIILCFSSQSCNSLIRFCPSLTLEINKLFSMHVLD